MEPAKLDEAWRTAQKLGREIALRLLLEAVVREPRRVETKPN